jgi:hypothetical protein
VKCTVPRQNAKFFLMQVPSLDIVSDGILLQVVSNKSDRFKVVVFDSSGGVAYIEESSPVTKYKTIARLMLSAFEVLVVSPPNPVQMLADIEAGVHQTFIGLSGLQKKAKKISPGSHLIGVYGDNWINSSRLEVSVFPSPNGEASLTARNPILEADFEINRLQTKLEAFKPEYMAAKKAFEEAEEKLKLLDDELVKGLELREAAYTNFIDKSQAFHPPPLPSAPVEINPAAAFTNFIASSFGGFSLNRKSSTT